MDANALEETDENETRRDECVLLGVPFYRHRLSETIERLRIRRDRDLIGEHDGAELGLDDGEKYHMQAEREREKDVPLKSQTPSVFISTRFTSALHRTGISSRTPQIL